MKKITLIIIAFLAVGQLNAQNCEECLNKFNTAFGQKDTAGVLQALQELDQNCANSPERYVAWFNYYWDKSISEVLSIQTEKPRTSDYMVLSDSLGNPAGYMYSMVVINDSALIDSALCVIDYAISQWPQRADMWFGKCHLLRTIGCWDEYKNTLITLIGKYPNQPMFFNKEPVDNATFSEAILDYQNSMFELVDPDNMTRFDTMMISRMRSVASAMVNIFPKDIEALNVLAITHNIFGEYQQALPYLLKANQIDKKDCIVLANLADVYHNLGDFKSEKKYLKQIKRYGNHDAKAYAKYMLEQLNGMD